MTTKQTIIFFALYENLLENQEGSHGKQIMPQLATSCTVMKAVHVLNNIGQGPQYLSISHVYTQDMCKSPASICMAYTCTY